MTRFAFLFTLAAMQLILASQSKYRKAQLESFGVKFTAAQPEIDEEQLKSIGPADLIELTRFLAAHKAESLRGRFPDAIIVGSDQIAECAGERLDKPGTHQRASEQLRRLSGKEHRLITSVVVVSPKASFAFTDLTMLKMRTLTDVEIEAYLRKDEPYDCAGSYKIEKAGMALIESVNSQDPSAIQGLPLVSLTAGLRKSGLRLEDFWKD